MTERRKKTKERYQNVVIKLSDGKHYTFTGKVCCEVGQRKQIVDIAFTEPQELRSPYTFEDFK